MNVTVKLFAMYRTSAPEHRQGQFVLQLAAGASVTDIVQLLGLPADEQKTVFVNGRISRGNVKLKDGDVIGIFPYISGG